MSKHDDRSAATVRVEHDGPVTIVSIDRPEARNAVDGPTSVLLADAFRAFDKDDDTLGRGAHRRRRHVLRGRGPEGHLGRAREPGPRAGRRTDGSEPHAARASP